MTTSCPRIAATKASSSEASICMACIWPLPVLALSSAASVCACAILRSAMVISWKSLVVARSRVVSVPIAPQPPRTIAFICLPAFHYDRLIGRWCRDPKYFSLIRSWITIAVRNTAFENDTVTFFEQVPIRADPELQASAQDHYTLLVRVVSVRLITRATARFDYAQDHLEFACQVWCQQVIAPLPPGVDQLPTFTPSHDMVLGRRRPLEKGCQRHTEGLRHLAERGHRRTC